MGTTGLIFAAIAVAWLVYLVPMFLNSRDQGDSVTGDFEKQLGERAKIVRASGVEDVYRVSTPHTRDADLYALHRMDVAAARRRRWVLLSLLTLTLLFVGLGLGLPRLVEVWWAAIPGGLAVAFLFVARLSVRAMRRDLDERRALILAGDEAEPTVGLMVDPAVPVDRTDEASYEHSVKLGEPVASKGSLWEPIPVTMPTYVSKPLAPRTVRTIDLSAPDVMSSARAELPATADPVEPAAEAPEHGTGERPRAVGE